MASDFVFFIMYPDFIDTLYVRAYVCIKNRPISLFV